MLQFRITSPTTVPDPDDVKIVGVGGASGAYAVKGSERDPEVVYALAWTLKM